MADSSLPSSPSPLKYDSFDLDVGTGEEGSSPSALSGSPSPTLTLPQGRDSDRAALIKEVTSLYKERYRLARMHRKAELRVVTSLKRRRQSEEGGGEEEMEEEDLEGGRVDWAAQAAKARASLLQADQNASAQELQYRLLLEEAREKAERSTVLANEAMVNFLHQQKALVKYSFSALPPEKNRGEVIEQLLKRQEEVEEQLKQARATYYSLALKKQQKENELKRRQETSDDQVSITEMLRLVVETEAYTEEAGVQECSILTSKGSLSTTEASVTKHMQRNKELSQLLEETEAKVEQLKIQISQKKDDLRELAKKQSQSNRRSAHLQPASRLLLDPVLAKDLKEKLSRKETLEDELGRLKQLSARSSSVRRKSAT
ncbi:trichohyalin-like [Penaeus japonicus]|uniref:trichohyalin-like n=1 Tax=Penaeus japonicus TaxID=27405 RepID=UPI001C70B61B|nr:trichohyalin-like [Penaeus japonicus]